MDIKELEQRWKLITNSGSGPYRSLRISSDCIPELSLAIDVKGYRFLILQIPLNVKVSCDTIQMENLSLEWYEEKHFILVGLLNNQFIDVYNDLTLSLYNSVKDISDPNKYTQEFIYNFNKWTEFFYDAKSNDLSEHQIKGLFGELIMLEWALNNMEEYYPNDILNAWQGPYHKSQDFIFPNHNLEVKTKNENEVNIHISSEYQLQQELGKGLKLVIIEVKHSEDGMNIKQLIENIKFLIFQKLADLSIFLKVISAASIGGANVDKYNSYKYIPLKLGFYNCDEESFPKIIKERIIVGISKVEYELNVTVLTPFLNNQIDL